MLRERREAMGITLAEVEVATRIRQKYLSALEAEEWHLLPGEVVGRGFLRNYADYLGLDPQEVMDRRRATTDSGMTQALATTSAGAPMPVEREVDYRPKEVELKDEGDGIQRGEIRLTPILAIIAVAAVVGLGLWGLATLREPLGNLMADARVGVADLFERPEPTATTQVVGVVNEQNLGEGTLPSTPISTPGTVSNEGVVVLGSGGDGVVPAATLPSDPGSQPVQPAGAAPVATSVGEVILVPTATTDPQAALAPTATVPVQEAPAAEVAAPTLEPPTPTLEPPTATPIPPTPTLEPPTATPEPLPTDTPVPAPTPVPVVAAASCVDPRSVISGPGINQVVSGVANITGSATHESFQYYKLEYAQAGGGFTYFGGGNVQIGGGVLGNLDTTGLPNGEYTIRLTVVDQTGNFPPPCDVTVVVQN